MEQDIEDGIIMSGFSSRTQALFGIMETLGYAMKDVAYASVLRCVFDNRTNIIKSRLKPCTSLLAEDLKESSITNILAFGSIAALTVLPAVDRDLNKYRNKVYVSPFTGISARITYSLDDITRSGCCGKNTAMKKSLLMKDIVNTMKDAEDNA